MLLFLSTYGDQIAAAFCPTNCKCDQQGTSSKMMTAADCTNANLTSYPILLNPRLKKLILSGNGLSSLKLDELSVYSDLEYLDLSNNKIFEIERGAFFRLQKLKVLRLNNNMITSLSIETFLGLTELRVLDLGQNSLTRLATSVFSDLPRLETLNLSSNLLNNIAPGALTNLRSLKQLHLADNQLTDLQNGEMIFRPIQSLKILNLQQNRLTSLDDDTFSMLGKLEILNLSSNLLDKIGDDTFMPLVNLKYLSLANNKLTRIPTMSFRQLTDLQTLDISSNFFVEIPTSAFEGLSSLKKLFINQCPELKSTSLNAFSGLFELETLFLSQNPKLSDLNPSSFEQSAVYAGSPINVKNNNENDDKFYEIVLLRETDQSSTASKMTNKENFKLKRLILSGNNLKFLPEKALPYEQLDELKIDGNPWLCDCKMKFLPGILKNIDQKDTANPDDENSPILCSSPEKLADKNLLQLNDQDFGYCKTDDDPYLAQIDWIFKMAALVSVLTLLTTLTCLTLRFKRRLCKFFCNKKYDAATSSASSSSISNSNDKLYYEKSSSISQSCRRNYYQAKQLKSPSSCTNGELFCFNGATAVMDHGVAAGATYYSTYNGYEYPTKRHCRGGDYRCMALAATDDVSQPTFAVATSDYYSGASCCTATAAATVYAPPNAEASSIRGRLSSASSLDRTSSFKIIQMHPIPITEV
uniref:LRRCT domain-containing protein n=1 Tax=Romanomermis culicivorax TaxID=13658 RepID=A0A915L7V0_ROMCU